MTIAIKKTAGENFQYDFTLDANEVDHPLTEWAHDPDISALDDEPREYWKWDDETQTVQAMTPVERQLVDDYGMEVTDDLGGVVKINISDNFPKSTIDGKKLSVHSSYKPEIDGSTTYAIWSGAGDDITAESGGNGEGPMLQLHTQVGVPETSVDIEFNHDRYGRVWLHEAYIKFTDGSIGDYMSCQIYAYGIPLQQSVQLDLIVEDDYIKFSPMGPGTGTHGFADPNKITFIDRTFSKDGDWDWSEETGLVPNFAGTGCWKMSTKEQVVHRFFNKISCYGSCQTYFSMSSDETMELKKGYFARMTAHNVSDTVWHLSAIMELYRETTYST